MEEYKLLESTEEIKAFSDPYRIQIINCFYKFGKPATVKQVADSLGEVPAKVHYHVKKLEGAGILHLTHTMEVNGIIAKYYEPTAKRFSINRPDLDPENLGEAMNETQKLAVTAYNTSRKAFLDSMGRNIFNGAKDNMGNISMFSLYLTEDEYINFCRYIEDFCDRHSKEDKKGGISEYHFFSGIIRIK